MKNFKPNKPMHYASWISPEGHIYSCPMGAHYDLARLILFEIYKISYEYQTDKIRNVEKFLEDEGYLKVGSYGQIFQYDLEITQQQLNSLFDLSNCKHHSKPPLVIKSWEGDGDRYLHGTPKQWQINMKRAIHHFQNKLDAVKG